VRVRLAAEVERLRPLARDVAWVAPANLHVTLKFLGGVEASRVEGVAAALHEAATGLAAFDLAIEGLGAFPSRTRPRVLWAGLGVGAAVAATLAERVDTALAGLGFPAETRPFAGHVTLGRVREPRANPRLAEALGAQVAFGRQPVGGVSLMRSDLSPRGARYQELAALPLTAASAPKM
jgi:2'-5' RNA ligase